MKKKENFNLPLAQRWSFGCSDGKSSVKNGYESLRFNLLELIELYSRCSLQRSQKSTKQQKNGASQSYLVNRMNDPARGMFPIGCRKIKPTATNDADKKTLPYFDFIRNEATKMLEFYSKNESIVK